MFKSIFKDLNGKWGKIDLEKESKKTKNVNFSNPIECEKWINLIHKKKKIDFSYGGFLKNRENLWKDHYNAKKQIFVHEGVDFNVPLNTEVFLFEDGQVVEIIREPKLNGGWGNAAVFWIPKIRRYAIFAHLKRKLFVKKKKFYKKGQKIGLIGSHRENGNYFPHLHLQIMKPEFARDYKRFKDIEGYSQKNHQNLKNLDNPLRFVK